MSIGLQLVGARRVHRGQIASATQFGAGDSSTSTFGLLDARGRPIKRDVSVSAIHRTDWQGRQLLYATVRTQICVNTQNFSVWFPYFSPALASLRSGEADPRGGTEAWSFEFGEGALGSAGRHGLYANSTSAASTASLSLLGIWARADEPIQISIGCLTSLFPQIPLNLTTAWTYFTGSPTIDSQTSSRNFILALNANLPINAGKLSTSRIYFAFPQFTQDATLGVYIPNTGTTPATLTDYTLTGPSVALGQVPVTGAVLDWDGSGTSVG